MPLVVATRAKLDPNLESLSRIRYFGACPNGVASLRCWATQGSDGERVTPTWMTLRDCSSIMKYAKSGRKNRSVTCKKSHAQIWDAWVREIGRPPLASWLVCTNLSHILLDRALTDMDAQFQEFSTNPFSTEDGDSASPSA
jgi:hypothetical protein